MPPMDAARRWMQDLCTLHLTHQSAVNVENVETHQAPEQTLAEASADDLLPRVVYLPPPLSASNFEFHLSQLRTALDDGYGLADVIKRWALLRDNNAVRMATTEDYQGVSNYLAGCFTKKRRLNVRKLHNDHPEKWGIMTHMAIEAAAHGHWHGLNEMLLHLLSAKMPQVTKTLWLGWHKRVREVLNRPWEMLFSEDRNERVRARLPDIAGVTPMILPFIASLAMLNEVTKDNFKFLLGVSAGRNDSSHSTAYLFEPLWQHLRALPNGKQLEQDVNQIWHDREVVQTIHHGDALATTLEKASLAKNFQFIEDLYLDMVRLATPGPNQLLVPVKATKVRLAADGQIVLPLLAWKYFGLAFSKFSEHKTMFKMATVDHPACYGQPDANLLADTMGLLAPLVRHVTGTEREMVLDMIKSLWDNIVILGHGSSGEPMVCRLRTISILGGSYTPTVVQAYFDSCWKKLRRDDDGQALSRLVAAQCSNILNTTPEKLPEFLEQYPSILGSRGWSTVVASIVTHPSPYAFRARLLKTALRLKPPHVHLRAHQFGRLLSFFIEGDEGDGERVKKCLNLTRKAMERWQHHEIVLNGVVSGILKTPRAGPVPLRYELTLRILEDLFPRGPDAHTSAQNNVWLLLLNKVASTKSLGSADRHNLIAAAVACYPLRTDYDLGMLYSMIIGTSLRRRDRHGVPEARYWMRQWTNPFRKQFHAALWHFVNTGHRDEAREFAAQHPNLSLPSKLLKAMGLDKGAGYSYDDEPYEVDCAEEIRKEMEMETEMENENDYDSEGDDDNTYAGRL